MSDEHIEAKPRKKHRHKKEYIIDRDKRAKLINIEGMINKYNSDIRRLSREVNTLQLKYQQVINLLRGIIKFQGRRTKRKVSVEDIIGYIERVVEEQDEEEVDLVEDALNR